MKGKQSEGGGGTKHRIAKQRNGNRQYVGEKTKDLAEIQNVLGKWRENKESAVTKDRTFLEKRAELDCVCVCERVGGGCRTEMRDRATSGGADAHILTRLHVRDSTTKEGPADSN